MRRRKRGFSPSELQLKEDCKNLESRKIITAIAERIEELYWIEDHIEISHEHARALIAQRIFSLPGGGKPRTPIDQNDDDLL